MEVAAFVLIFSILSGLTATATAAAVDNYSTANATDQGMSVFTEPGISEFEEPRDRYASSQGICPTWFRRDSEMCTCGSSLDGVVHCHPSNQTSILSCNCMTFSNISERLETVVGPCIYNCFNTTSYAYKATDYSYLPSNVSQLNDRMCDHLNRKGVLCGDCKENFYLAWIFMGT